MRFLLAFVVATLSGYIALSYEILWVRTYSFLTEARPDAFALLLAAYLGGLALGSFVARRACPLVGVDGRRFELRLLGLCLLIGNVGGFFAIPLAAHLVTFWYWTAKQTLMVFALVSAFLGTAFPLAAHFGILPDEKAGSRLSYLYVGNVVGSVAGSLTTGFYLLDRFSLGALSLLLASGGIMVSGVLLLAAARSGAQSAKGLAMAMAALCVVWSSKAEYDRVYEKLLYRVEYIPGRRFAHTIENKNGVVNVTSDGVVYGGGSYEGQFNTNPLPDEDRNRVVRAYAIPAFHPDPKDILMIGLGSGSWLEVLANAPDVESVTVVEINPGFVEAMGRQEAVAEARLNPKVTIVIDDGRRYMQRTDRRFDVIVQNTIVYWRAHATNLLSREYFELSRRHLKPGGIVYYNTTVSTASQKTGATVFPYAVRFQNMLIASDSPITIDRERWRRKLYEWRLDGAPVLDKWVQDSDLDPILYETTWRGKEAWEDRAAILARTRDEVVITDDNMASEWFAYNTYP